MRVYHRTTAEAKAAIEAAGCMTGADGYVYVTNRCRGDASVDYGPAVVVLDIPKRLLELDDEFPDGEAHYRLPAREVRAAHIVKGG